MNGDWWAGYAAGLISGGVLVLICFAVLMALVFHLAKPHAQMDGRTWTDLRETDDPPDDSDRFLRDLNNRNDDR